MSAWLVRKQGAPDALSVASAGEVLTGLRDGNWLPTDEVKGPTDTDWQPIEVHPTFAEAAGEIEPPRPETDETSLDMNPLIDVCLVLLIFFILTITYASLERSIAIPTDTPDQKGPAQVKFEDIKDRVFVVQVKMNGEKAVIRIEKEETPADQIDRKMKDVIAKTGRKEMVLDIDKDVPWGIEAAILDAAQGNGVRDIINNYRK